MDIFTYVFYWVVNTVNRVRIKGEDMKEFLFGWLTKPEILHTPLDEVMYVIEILILIFVIIPIGIEIITKIEDFFQKGNK